MNFEFAQQINPSLENLDFSKTLNIAESALKKIPATKFILRFIPPEKVSILWFECDANPTISKFSFILLRRSFPLNPYMFPM